MKELKAEGYFTNSSNVVSSDRVIYTPSAFARSSLLSLQETGRLSALKPHMSSRANLASYLFFVILSGTGKLYYKGDIYNLSVGDCVFLDCSSAYSHTTDKELWTLSWCHFYGPEMPEIYDKYINRGGKTVFRSSKFDEYKKVLNLIKSMAISDSYVRDMELNSLLSHLLVLLMEDSWNPDLHTSGTKKNQILKVKEYIDIHYSTNITLEKLSKIFFMNKTYLSELFKETYDMTIKDYIISVRVTEAKKLLRFTDKTMDEIAIEIGINGAAYFSRMFKRVEGVSPKEYRLMW